MTCTRDNEADDAGSLFVFSFSGLGEFLPDACGEPDMLYVGNVAHFSSAIRDRKWV